MKMSIKRPAVVTALPWEKASEQILAILNNKYGIVPEEENCGTQLLDFLGDDALRYVALQLFGNTLPKTILMVAELMLMGDGACPYCGSNQRTERIGSFEYMEAHGMLSRTIGWDCKVCGEEVTV
jgi:hypothetical protein